MDGDPFPSCGIRDETEHLKTAYTLSERGSLCRSYFKSEDAVSVFMHLHLSAQTQVQVPATVIGLPGCDRRCDRPRTRLDRVGFQVKLEEQEQAECIAALQDASFHP